MKYKIQFILDKGIPTDRMRDIKLNLLEQSVDMSLISDYPIDIPNDFIYLSDINFKILKKEVRITNGFYNIEVTILDTETLDIITDQDQVNRSSYKQRVLTIGKNKI
jgi:hypothetical protein